MENLKKNPNEIPIQILILAICFPILKWKYFFHFQSIWILFQRLIHTHTHFIIDYYYNLIQNLNFQYGHTYTSFHFPFSFQFFFSFKLNFSFSLFTGKNFNPFFFFWFHIHRFNVKNWEKLEFSLSLLLSRISFFFIFPTFFSNDNCYDDYGIYSGGI